MFPPHTFEAIELARRRQAELRDVARDPRRRSDSLATWRHRLADGLLATLRPGRRSPDRRSPDRRSPDRSPGLSTTASPPAGSSDSPPSAV
jgi:hypothetical protein